MIEADVHLRAGRVEVRHLKTAGPLPVLWDRWELASARAPRLLIDRLLAAAGRTELMLDLKGRDPRLAVAVADAIRRQLRGWPVTVCSRSWPLLDAMPGVPGLRRIHSVGSRAQLAALGARMQRGRVGGVSIHRRLLAPAVVARLRAGAEVVMTWPVATLDEALALASWALTGSSPSASSSSRRPWPDAGWTVPPDAGAVLAAMRAAGERLAEVDPRLALAALALHVSNHLLRSAAWRGVLAAAYPDRRVPLMRVAAAYASGVALNAVTPARGGDAVKVGLARAAIPGSSVATIVLAVGLSGAMPLAPSTPAVAAVPGWIAGHALLSVVVAGAAAVVVRVVALALRTRLRTLWDRVRQGGVILRAPRRYLRTVVLPQSCAWCCRVGVVVCLLAAFGLPASVPVACVVMVLTGASTVVPLTPGGAGTQQVVLAFALSQTASAAAVVSFSVGMQAGVTAVNGLLGLVAAMAMFRTLRPVAAVRAGLGAARAPAA
jgi:uncharacterized membrane protein YbhN (UPF0104 family)